MAHSPVRRALVSTFEKEGVLELARGLHALGVEILSTGGTARLLAEGGVPVVKVSDHTGFPEILDGRVKTLHPKIHGGLLGRRANPEHVAQMAAHGIAPIDLLVVNLYPFEKTRDRAAATDEEIVEMIDIGGPAMLRAAAKNHDDVGVLVDPADYPAVLGELREHGGLSPATRRRLAARAFDHTARYDRAVSDYLAGPPVGFPERLDLSFVKHAELVYGENPHQKAAFYRDGPAASGVGAAAQLQGKPLSFNNLLDFDAAVGLAADLAGIRDAFGCVIVKHGNPCGTAFGDSPEASFRRALACDPTSAFGGVIAFPRAVDSAAAAAIAEAFYEGVIAPSFSDDALAVLARKKNLRVLAAGPLAASRRGHDLRRVDGGLLVQDWDGADGTLRGAKVATKRAPTESEWRALEFAWCVVRHVKSNAIVYAFEDRTVGVGAGQMSRVDSARIAIQKANESLKGASMASDAFFPFRDGLDVAAEAGITAVVQPGGSIRDEEVIAAADERGLAMILVGRRHFRH
jgi:phosphoribosylaminoimidazolecarboxamide formyltransferase/IMP cyclohydrolase